MVTHGIADTMVAELREFPRTQVTTYTACGLTFVDDKLVHSGDRGKHPGEEAFIGETSLITCEKCRTLMAEQVDKALRARPAPLRRRRASF